MDRRKRPSAYLNPKKRKQSSYALRTFFQALPNENAFSYFKKMTLIFSVLIFIIISYYFWSSGYISQKINHLNQFMHRGIASVGFEVHDIVVEGRSLTTQKEILDILNVDRSSSVFIPSLNQVKQDLEKLPWVRSATIQRRLPDVIYVRLSERRPIAIWQNKSKMFLVDDQGRVMENPNTTLPLGLIISTGDGAPENVSKLIEALENFPDIAQKVTGALFISRRRWDIIIDHKLKLKLSESNPKESLSIFWKLMKEHKLEDKEIVSIDLRFKDRVYFQVSSNAMDPKKAIVIKTPKNNI